MPLADHGGFDVAVEVPEATALTIARGLSFGSASKPFTNTRISGTSTIVATVSSVSLISPDRMAVDIDISGTRINVLKAFFLGIPVDVAPWMQLIEPKGSIKVNAPLAMSMTHSLVVTFSPSGNDPIVTVNLLEDSILASPLVTMLLAREIGGDPANGALYLQKKAEVLADFLAAINESIRASLTKLGAVVLSPAPTLPSSASGASNLISSSAFVILPRSIKLCYGTRTGSGGSTAAISISNLVRSTATGVPADAMAICVSNAFILRDLLRDAFTIPPPVGLGIPLFLFQRNHPLMLLGPLVLTVPGGPIPGIASLTVNSIFGGIDGTNIRLLMRVTANGAAGAFTISAAIDAAFSVTAGPGSPPSLSVGLAGPPSITTELSIAWWVYVGAALLPDGLTLVSILATGDLFAGSVADRILTPLIGGLAGGLGGTFSAPLVSGLPPLTVRPPLSLRQPNAIRRTVAVSIPGVPVALPIVDPFLDNDLLLTFV